MRALPIVSTTILACCAILTAYTAPATCNDTPVCSSTATITKTAAQKTLTVDPFILAIAHEFTVEPADLQRLHNRGYGRTELISLLIIARDAAVPLADVVTLRDQKTRIAAIADTYHLAFPAVMMETEQIYRTVNLHAPLRRRSPEPEVDQSTGTVSGELPSLPVSDADDTDQP